MEEPFEFVFVDENDAAEDGGDGSETEPWDSYLILSANGIKIQKAEQVKGLKRTSQMFNVNQCDVLTRPRPSEGDMQSDEED